jgi:hypothetical protein
MTTPVVNADNTLIPDQAEVWLALKSDVTNITALIPTAPDDDLDALGWEFTGLIDSTKGIALNPSIEVKEYDAFGHPKFRVKLKKGKLTTDFTALETNEATKKIVLPGSAANKLGAPKDVQVYVLYRFVDEDVPNGTKIWVSLTAAPVELKSHGGIIDGELSFAEITVHHTTDANNDIFQVVGDAVTTQWTATLGTQSSGTFTLTWGGNTTTAIAYNATAATVKSALVALDDGYTSADWTVSGSAGGPYTITPPHASAVSGSGASLGTPGTFVIAPV